MSISSVSSAGTPDQAFNAAVSGMAGAQPSEPQQNAGQTAEAAKTPASTDTVHLSAAAQALALKQSGETAAQIAVDMNTDVKTVDGYLGIQAAAATPAPAPVAVAASPAPAPAPIAATAAPQAKVDIRI